MPHHLLPRCGLTLSLTGALLLGGCAAGIPASQSGDDELTVALGASPVNLDYTTTAGAAIPQALLYNVYEPLLKIDAEGELQPLLAESWEVSEDRLSYTFTLRSGVEFSDGTPMTAEDAADSLNRLEDWTTAPRGLLSGIEEAFAQDDRTLVVRLAEPDNMVLENLAGPGGTVFKPGTEATRASEALGTGPYTVTSATPGVSIQLEAHEGYWGETPPTRQLSLEYYADATAQANALLSGGADVALAFPAPQLLGQFEDEAAFTVHAGTTNGEMILPINRRHAPLDDIRVRQAIRHAVDGDAVREVAAEGYGTSLSTMVPPTDPWFDDRENPYPYDPDRARELLAEAGAEGITLDFPVPAQPVYLAASQVVASQLEEVGLRVRTRSVEFPAVWLGEVFSGHQHDISIINSVEPRDVVQFADPDYYFGHDDPELIDLLHRARTGPQEDYVPLMREFAQQTSDLAGVHVLYLTPWITVARSDVSGVMPNLAGESYDLTELARVDEETP